MPNTNRYTRILFDGVKHMWRNWAIAFGALSLVNALSAVVPKVWFPLVVILIGFFLIGMLHYRPQREHQVCRRLIYVASVAIMWTAAIMVAINIVAADWFPLDIHRPENFTEDSRPFITALIIYPLIVITTGLAIWRGERSAFCLECRATNSYDPSSGILGRTMETDTVYQLKLLCRFSIFLSIVTWGYYALYYIDTDINTPDLFFFMVFPSAIYVLSLIYMGARYANMWISLRERCSDFREHRVTMRFLIFRDDYIYLADEKECLMKGVLIDTPAKLTIDTGAVVTIPKAVRSLKDISGIDAVNIKRLYRSADIIPDTAVVHFAVFLPNDYEIDPTLLPGKWYTLNRVNTLLHERLLAVDFAHELYRIYTITMAWKTYDRNGNRLYPIKNYRPTFRFRDFKDWDVDYSDLRWLSVADNNEDRRFWRLRRFWRRYTGASSE